MVILFPFEVAAIYVQIFVGWVVLNTACKVFGFPNVVCVDSGTRSPNHPTVHSRTAILFLHVGRYRDRKNVVVSLRGLYVCPTVNDLKNVQVELRCPLWVIGSALAGYNDIKERRTTRNDFRLPTRKH